MKVLSAQSRNYNAYHGNESEEQSFDAMLKYNLEAEIYSFRILGCMKKPFKNYNDTDKKGLVHIKLDTGMHRLGFEKNDLPELGERLKSNPE